MRIALNVYTLPYVGAKSLGVYHSGLEIEQFLEPHPYFDQAVPQPIYPYLAVVQPCQPTGLVDCNLVCLPGSYDR